MVWGLVHADPAWLEADAVSAFEEDAVHHVPCADVQWSYDDVRAVHFASFRVYVAEGRRAADPR